ncbi:MAG: ion transporter [Fimbriiglobus sp.]|jgi:hypothetical protein|nr:ion transporter [Fimbriiglobus sp.]
MAADLALTLATPPHDQGPSDTVRKWVKWLAPILFWLAFAHLLALAGLIHRADERYPVFGWEKLIIRGVLFVLWPLLAAEAVVGFFFRNRNLRVWPVLARTVAVCLFPPARMGLVHPVTGLIWLPRLGWEREGKELIGRLDRGFSLPLLLFALLLIPVLAVEYVWKDVVEESAAFGLFIHGCMALIWVAFATEFILKMEASGNPFRYAQQKWLDAAIVLLPMLEFVLTTWASAAPVARLLRTARVLAPDKLARMGQMYRLRGLLMKVWHAMLALELLARLTGDNPRKRLARLEAEIATAEAELATLRAEAEATRARLNSPAVGRDVQS